MTLLLPRFQLSAFAFAFANDLTQGSAAGLRQHYDPEAEIRVLHLDRVRGAAELLHGWDEIADWFGRSLVTCIAHRVTRLVDNGDHVEFNDERQEADGRWVVAQNMAEIRGGRIGHQYAIIGWDLEDRNHLAIGPMFSATTAPPSRRTGSVP